MNRILGKTFIFFYIFAIPFLTLSSPGWLSLNGIRPSWSILWLLPFSLESGPIWGAASGVALGLILDGLTLGGPTHLPALIILGLWWGRLGYKSPSINLSLNIGLLAWIGTFLLGLTIWLQLHLMNSFSEVSWFNAWAISTLFTKAFITALFAPILSSWLLLAYRLKRRNTFKS